jgi:hypothetical protein
MVGLVREKLEGKVEVDEFLYGGFEEGHPGRGPKKNPNCYCCLGFCT